MKYIALGCLATLLLAACSSPNSDTAKTDTIINNDSLAKAKNTAVNNNTPTIYSLCFLSKKGRDSTSVELVVHGNKVTGQMNWLPYQKDSRKGTLYGTIINDTIHATWTFMQEGMKDTLKLNFLFKNSQLSLKPLKLNTKTGREQTDEKAGYEIAFDSDTKLHK
ncbi:hypothetical protein [Mucilaginibacter sp. UYCu711]|uniref:hypothetical protein n=1 Tax=Mucilaginibacter sp. UYCu711 TaxID=3156339 RepID=UPI003D22F33A